MHRARKRFGQNFLQDQAIIERIIAAIRPTEKDHLVEIGPGQGALTIPLLAKAGRLDAIEIDRDLAPNIQLLDPSASTLKVHQADALRFDLQTLAATQKLRIIGNLPYNISTPLLFHLLGQLTLISDMHFMLQKEVVDRICSVPGNKIYGRLSVMVQCWCECESLFTVPPTAFRPAPQVDSAIIRLRPRPRALLGDQNPNTFKQLVTAAFGQRRKTIAKALSKTLRREQIVAADIDPKARAEVLSVEDFVRLASVAELSVS